MFLKNIIWRIWAWIWVCNACKVFSGTLKKDRRRCLNCNDIVMFHRLVIWTKVCSYIIHLCTHSVPIILADFVAKNLSNGCCSQHIFTIIWRPGSSSTNLCFYWKQAAAPQWRMLLKSWEYWEAHHTSCHRVESWVLYPDWHSNNSK